MYGVETRDINKAVKNNPKKFPPGYIIELNSSEKQELVENFHRFNTLKHSTVAPHAFTEQGLYMLATILKGEYPVFRKLAEIGDLRKLSREELELYDEDIKNMRDIYATRKFDEKKGMEIGIAKGMEKGMAKEKIATAYRLLSMGLSEAQVATATELPLEEILKMKE